MEGIDTRARARYYAAMETGIEVFGPDPVAVEAAIGHLISVMAAIHEYQLDRETGIEALQKLGDIVSTNISNCVIGDRIHD